MYFNYAQTKQKGSAHPLLIIGFLLILILGGGYLYQVKSLDNLIKTSKSAVLKQPESQDYLNKTLGFRLKYPNNVNLKIDTEEEFNKRGGGDFRKNFKGYVQYEPGKVLGGIVVLDKSGNFETNPFTLWVFDNPEDLSIDSWYKNYWYYPFVWGDFTYTGKFELAPKTEATISGQMGKSGIIDYQPGKPRFVYLVRDKKMYLFRIIGDKDKTGDKILSTFKYTN